MHQPIRVPVLTLVLATSAALAQNSAPSSHLVFDDNFDGDIIVNEVRVPKSGEALYTYYEALGWRGKGAGYAGIQAHPKARLYIFSIWDHKQHRAPIRAVHRGPGTKTVGFGGEGTGLKSWNFDLGWSTDVWYTLVARTWPVGDHTYYGFWSRAGDNGKWTHLVTMDVAVKTTFRGGTDAFIEDWLSTGKQSRTAHLRGGWKRKTDGTWFPFGRGRYSVNSWDLVPGKRSYNFRESWDGGVGRDATGEFYYMVSGGAGTRPSTKNPSVFSIKRTATAPGYAKIALVDAKATSRAGASIAVEWTVDDKTAPPFEYEIKLFGSREARGKPLATLADRVPHARAATLDVSKVDLAKTANAESGSATLFAHLTCSDIFDRRSETRVIAVRRSAD